MSPPEKDSADEVAWARRVNSRWIVHQGLGASAEAYLNHLAQTDSERLARSCRHAQQLVRECGQEDKKPWFYAGLFSLATVNEARKFLTGHWFTILAVPPLAAELGSSSPPINMSEPTRDKLQKIREKLTRLLAST